MGGQGTLEPLGQRTVLTLSEAAGFVRVSEKTLGELARGAKIPCQKVGREWRFLRPAVEAWLARNNLGQSTHESLLTAPIDVVNSTGLRLSSGRKPANKDEGFGDTAFTLNQSEPMHRWVPWIAGFSSAFVAQVLDCANGRAPAKVTVLDPFAGVGTTVVEALKRGHKAIAFEINPYAALVVRVKVACLLEDLSQIASLRRRFLKYLTSRKNKAPRSLPPAGFKSRVPFFSAPVERKVLHAIDFVSSEKEQWLCDVFKVALGAILVDVSNYSYEPSLGRKSTVGKADVLDADVGALVAAKLSQIAEDGAKVRFSVLAKNFIPDARVFDVSYFEKGQSIKPHSIDYVITSPPYLNNYHYIRNTRPHLYWLGLVGGSVDLHKMEHASFGTFWQTVRSGPLLELAFKDKQLEAQLDVLRTTNEGRGVYGGAGWANYAVAYFNDCWRFCTSTLGLMRPGGSVVVVIGNNILQGVEFKTDQIFAGIASQCGFEVVALHQVRAKRTGSSIVNSSVRRSNGESKVMLYESAVELRSPATRN